MSSTSPSESPPPASVLPPRHVPDTFDDLPVPLVPILGREREIDEIRTLLDRDDTRLLTLTGPGGIGKTRLALEIAALVRDDFAHGVCFVSLATIRDPGLVPSAVARALGVRESGDRPAAAVVATALRSQHRLLVFDNLEQVVDAGLWLAELLAACPRVKALVTSRVHLHIRGEKVFPVPPLGLPEPARRAQVEALARAPAVALFVERARAVRPSFALTDENAEAVRAICRRLDGLPLAIELAAARVSVLSPAAILARLTDRLSLLSGSLRNVPARLQTMQNAIGWSYELLTPEERAFFRRLSIFAGAFPLEAAEAVALIPGDPPVASDVIDLLTALVSQSLAQRAPSDDDEPRFELLETIRDYGVSQLAATGEHGRVARWHATWFLALAEAAAPHLTGPKQVEWLRRLDDVHDDLRAAFAWLHANGEHALALRLATALWRFGYTRGYLREARDRLDTALASSTAPTRARAAALNAAGLLASTQADLAAADACHTEALALCRELDDRSGVAVALNGLGDVAAAEGNLPLAVERYETAQALFREMGDRRGIAGALTNLGNLAWGAKDLSRASALHQEARFLYRAIGERRGVAWSVTNLGGLAVDQGDLAAGTAYLTEAIALYRELGDQAGLVLTLEGFAEIARARGQREREATLLSAALAAREALGMPIAPSDRPRVDAAIADLRQNLGPAFVTAWAIGEGMMVDEALGAAIATQPAPVPRAPLPAAEDPAPDHGLTRRELEVLRLMATGMGNQEIADALFVSHRTVTSHVSNILGKLGVSSRTAVVAWALRHGLG
jgi:non-specific serine/threonine protein kinase